MKNLIATIECSNEDSLKKCLQDLRGRLTEKHGLTIFVYEYESEE